MKTSIFKTICCLSLLVLAACSSSNDTTDTPQPAAQRATLIATLPGADSRVMFEEVEGTDATKKNLKVNWESGDNITVRSYDANGKQLSSGDFVTDNAGQTATFTNNSFTFDGAAKIRARYPVANDDNVDCSSQDATSLTTLGKSAVMVALSDYTTGTTPTLAFKNVFSILRLNLTIPVAGTVTKVEVVSKDGTMAKSGTYSFDQNNDLTISTSSKGSMTATTNISATANTPFTVYMLILPQTGINRMYIMVTTATDQRYYKEMSSNNISIERNKIYTITKTLDADPMNGVAVGDIVYTDGTYSAEKIEGKTVAGVCCYLGGQLKDYPNTSLGGLDSQRTYSSSSFIASKFHGYIMSIYPTNSDALKTSTITTPSSATSFDEAFVNGWNSNISTQNSSLTNQGLLKNIYTANAVWFGPTKIVLNAFGSNLETIFNSIEKAGGKSHYTLFNYVLSSSWGTSKGKSAYYAFINNGIQLFMTNAGFNGWVYPVAPF